MGVLTEKIDTINPTGIAETTKEKINIRGPLIEL